MKEGDEGEGHVEMRQGVRGLSGTCQEKVVKKKMNQLVELKKMYKNSQPSKWIKCISPSSFVFCSLAAALVEARNI